MYEVGQKILVEATVRDPEIDRDGDIQVYFETGDCVYIPAANTKPIDPEPQKIAFEDVRVGDVVRVSTKCTDGTVIMYEGTVTKVPSKNMFHIGNGRSQWIDMLDDDAIELISRPEPEPEPINVEDKIAIDQVKTLPSGSVVEYFGQPRFVAPTGLLALTGETLSWSLYGTHDKLTVKYIAEQA